MRLVTIETIFGIFFEKFCVIFHEMRHSATNYMTYLLILAGLLVIILAGLLVYQTRSGLFSSFNRSAGNVP